MISEKQASLLAFIARSIEEQKIVPSMKEIAAAVGLHSAPAAFYHIRRLERLGYLAAARGRARSFRVLRVPETVAA